MINIKKIKAVVTSVEEKQRAELVDEEELQQYWCQDPPKETLRQEFECQ